MGSFVARRRKARCKAEGKVRWVSRLDALMASANVLSRRVYKCPHCGDWHMTSQPKRRS